MQFTVTFLVLVVGIIAQACSARFDAVLSGTRSIWRRSTLLFTTKLGLVRLVSIVCLYGGAYTLAWLWDLNWWLRVLLFILFLATSFILAEILRGVTCKLKVRYENRAQPKRYDQNRP